MIKKKSSRSAENDCDSGSQKKSSSNSDDISNNNSSLDHQFDESVIREPINLGVKNVHQILTCITSGTKEVKDLIFNECEIIYECRVCRSLFRSLANFLAHKRAYCTQHYCQNMVLFESNWLDLNSSTMPKTAKSPKTEVKSLERTPLVSNNVKSEDQEFVPKVENSVSINCDKTISHESSKRSSTIENNEKRSFAAKKQRIETLMNRLAVNSVPSAKSNENQPNINCDNLIGVRSNDQQKIKVPQTLTLENNSKVFCDKNSETSLSSEIHKINFICMFCSLTCSYLSSAVRHLTNIHKKTRYKAKCLVYDFLVKNDSATLFMPRFKKIKKESSFNEPETLKNDSETKKSGSNKKSLVTVPSTNNNISIDLANRNRRYQTRFGSVKKKCFYDCKDCYLSKLHHKSTMPTNLEANDNVITAPTTENAKKNSQNSNEVLIVKKKNINCCSNKKTSKKKLSNSEKQKKQLNGFKEQNSSEDDEKNLFSLSSESRIEQVDDNCCLLVSNNQNETSIENSLPILEISHDDDDDDDPHQLPHQNFVEQIDSNSKDFFELISTNEESGYNSNHTNDENCLLDVNNKSLYDQKLSSCSNHLNDTVFINDNHDDDHDEVNENGRSILFYDVDESNYSITIKKRNQNDDDDGDEERENVDEVDDPKNGDQIDERTKAGNHRSKLTTKLHIKKFDLTDLGHSKIDQTTNDNHDGQSKLKIHLRTTGSKKHYQIVKT